MLAEDWDSGWDLGTGGRPPYEHIVDDTEIPFEFGLYIDREFSQKWNGQPIDLSEDSEFTNLYVQIEHGLSSGDELGNHLLHITECTAYINKFNETSLEYEVFNEFVFLDNGCPMKNTHHILKMKESRTEWITNAPMFNKDQFVFYPSYFPDGSYQMSYMCKYALCPSEAFRIQGSPVGQVCRLSREEARVESCDERYDNLFLSRSNGEEYDRSDEFKKKIDFQFTKGITTASSQHCEDKVLTDTDYDLKINVMLRDWATGEVSDWDGTAQRPEFGKDFVVEISNKFESESELKYNILHLDTCKATSYYYDRLNPSDSSSWWSIENDQEFIKNGCLLIGDGTSRYYEMTSDRTDYSTNEIMLKKDQFLLPNLFALGFGDGTINVTVTCDVRLCTSDSFNGHSACKICPEGKSRYNQITTDTQRCPHQISKVKTVSAYMLHDSASSLVLSLPLILLLLL